MERILQPKRKHPPLQHWLLMLGLIFTATITLQAQIVAGNSSANVTSDKPDYAPRTNAVFTGTGFSPGETVVLKVKNLNQPCNTVSADSSYLLWSVNADSDGGFVTNWTVCDCNGDSLRLKATGQTSGFVAFAYFKDAASITSVLPNSGPTTGGTAVTITGTGFTAGGGPWTVVFGNSSPVSATPVAGSSNTKLSATTPGNAAGTVNVTVIDKQNNRITLNNGFSFNKVSQTITFNAIQDKTYGSPTVTLSATASSGLPVTYTIVSGPATISGNDLFITGAGTIKVRATQAGDNFYNAAVAVENSFNVAKADQTITWSIPAKIVYGTALSATQLNANVAGVTNGTPAGALTYLPAAGNILNAGTHTLEVTAAETDNYKPASKSVTLIVDKAPLTIIVDSKSKVYGVVNPTLTGTITGVVNRDNITVSYGTTAFQNSNVGSYPITGTLNDPDTKLANYNVTNTSNTLEITPSDQTISFSSLFNKTYGDAPFTVSATTSSGLPVSFSIVNGPANISGSNIDITGAGTVTVKASQSGNTNFNAATDVIQNFNVAKADQTITWTNPANIVYGIALSPTQLDATVTGVVNGTSTGALIYNPASGTILNAGSHTLSVTAEATANYNSATKTVNLVVNKAKPEITWSNPTGITYGTTLSGTQLNASANVAGSFIYTPAAGIQLDAGNTQVLSVEFNPTDVLNYTSAFKNVTIDVAKANANITVNGYTGIYDGNSHGASGGSTGVNGENLSSLLNLGGSFTNVPGGNANWVFDGNDNYNYVNGNAAITIDQKPASVTPIANSKVYGTADPVLTGTLNGFLTGDNVEATYSRVAGETVAAGPYAISATLSPAGILGNYDITYHTADFTITPMAITATIAASNKTYDGTPVASATGNATGVNSAPITVSVSNAVFEDANVGIAKLVTAKVAISDDNYNLTSTTASTTANIITRSITLEANANQGKVFGDSDPIFTYTPSEALITGNNFTGALCRVAGNNVGTYAFTLGTLSAGNNYSLSLTGNNTFAITPKSITATIAASNKGYDGNTIANASGSATGVNGASVVVTVSNAAFGDPNIGTAKNVTAKVAISDNNYSLTSATASTTADITAKQLTPLIIAQNKKYDGTTTATLNSLSVIGMVIGETVGLSVTSADFASKNAGTHTVTATGLSLTGTAASNYVLAANATATATADITKLNLVGYFTAANKVYDGNTSATVTNYSVATKIGSDDVNIAGGTATFGTSAAGVGKTVTLTGAALAGADKDNYNLTSVSTASADITPAALTVSAPNINIYCGQTPPAGSCTVTGCVPGENIATNYLISGNVVNPACIDPKDPVLLNYKVTFLPGVLTTNPIAANVAEVSTPRSISQPVIINIPVKINSVPAGSGIPVDMYIDELTKVSALTVNGVATFNLGTKSVNVYKVKTVAGCDEQVSYLPVYDPDGGFVTGGGWINSPLGALAANPYATGKANFGFVAKYKKGSNLVDGNTEFQFQTGNLNFKSTSHTGMSLVISGSKATYKGRGTINGIGDYNFMVIATDGDINGGGGIDKFRIKIWDDSNNNCIVLYDNQMGAGETVAPITALGGGSIVIHEAVKGGSGSGKREIAAANEAPTTYQFQSYPNPFSESSTIRFALDTAQKFDLIVYDIRGSIIKNVASGVAEAGKVYEYQIDGKNLSEGIYFVRLITTNEIKVLKMVKKDF
jgi:hypothetical protein